MAHKITAIRMKEVKGETVLEGLTQSPRGTRLIARHVKFVTPKEDKAKLKTDLLSAVAELLNQSP